ncbi:MULTISPECIES: two-component system activity regulator YycH [unclassified Virgibacillus]|uniref:YycH family regulatory protein n=1 Tax=unclassified Virgibacillus TaxID=2620237 RepID=UPI0024DE0C0A|nr:two-component system activity regulator YycH [Virgibacillus sp. LDC-1]
MRLEVVKTYVLVILVGLSLLLTFNIWSFQPNFDSLDLKSSYLGEDEFYLNGKDQKVKQLIEPSNIIFHRQGVFYGFESPKIEHSIYQDMQTWMMYDFRLRENAAPMDEKYQVEIQFPVQLPMKLINSLFNFNEDINELPNWSFERMYITFNREKSLMTIHFVSVDGRNEATAIVNNATKFDTMWKYMNQLEGLEQYVLVEGARNPIYIPKYPEEVTMLTLSASQTDPKNLVNALFNNPFTSVTWNSDLKLYTDGSRQMRIVQERRYMEFTNPKNNKDFIRMGPIDLIVKSMNNINEYKGWTDDYNLQYIDTSKNLIRYLMYYEGYPVFNNSNLTEIEQQWRDQDIFQYQRPLFSINNSFGGDPVELPSADEVITSIKENKNIDVKQIEDIRIGYTLRFHNTNFMTLTLEPAWYMNYNGDWKEIIQEDMLQNRGVS